MKHYHENDFENEFLLRLYVYTNPSKNQPVHEFLRLESQWEEVSYVPNWDISDKISRLLSFLRLPYSSDMTRWGTAARVNESARKGTRGIIERFMKWVYEKKLKLPRTSIDGEDLYEEALRKDIAAWKNERKMLTLLLLLSEAAIMCLIEVGFNILQDYSTHGSGFVDWALGWLKFALIFFGVNWLLSFFIGIPELSNIIRNSVVTFWDNFVIRHAPKDIAYNKDTLKEKYLSKN